METKGNASFTASLPRDGIFTNPYTPILEGETDANGNVVADPGFRGKGITDTQLTNGPMFSPGGRSKYQQHSASIQTVKDGKDVNLITEVKQTSGLLPVRSLLRRQANFAPNLGDLKRQTSRTKEIVRERDDAFTFDASTFRMSFRRPEFIAEQQDQESKLFDLELGLPNDDITNPVAKERPATTLATTIDEELADLTSWD